MKYIFIILMLYIVNIANYGVNYNHFYSKKKNIQISFIENTLEIIILPTEKEIKNDEGSDDLYGGEIIFSSRLYHYRNDTLIVIKDKKQYFFRVINKEIFYALSNINKHIEKGDKFYCTRYEYSKDESLYGGDWKNNKKEGKWFYKNKGGLYIYTYKDGKLIKKEIIYTKPLKYKRYLDIW